MANFADDSLWDAGSIYMNFEQGSFLSPEARAIRGRPKPLIPTHRPKPLIPTHRPEPLIPTHHPKPLIPTHPSVANKAPLMKILIPAAKSTAKNKIPTAAMTTMTKSNRPNRRDEINLAAAAATTTTKSPATQAQQKSDFILNPSNLVCFFGRNHFLSNFFPHPITINGHRYFNVEHYYEAVKLFALLGPQGAIQLKNVQDPGAAKALANRLIADSRIDRKRVDKWRLEYGIPVINLALSIKFAPDTELSRKLLATGGAFLAHANPRDKLWAVNMTEKEFRSWMQGNDGKTVQLPATITAENAPTELPTIGRDGKNILGFLLMELRLKLKSGEANAATVVSGTDHRKNPPTPKQLLHQLQKMPSIAEEVDKRGEEEEAEVILVQDDDDNDVTMVSEAGN